MRITATQVKYPSLYFNWLPNSIKKGLPHINLIIIDHSDNYSGAFYRRCNYSDSGELLGTPVSMINTDTIVITDNCSWDAVLAHEYRHFWQLYTYGVKYFEAPLYTSFSDFISKFSYKESVIKYFTNNWAEMDALNFELKTAKNDLNSMYREWVIKFYEWKYTIMYTR